ncbi:MAG: tRNA (guanine-N1)-methyltransferase [Bacteroidia bacterium]
MTKFILTLAGAMVISLASIAQDTTAVEDKRSLDSGPIEERFDYMIDKSNRFQEYRVVKQTWLHKLKGHVVDSLKVLNNELNQAQNAITQHKAQKDSMAAEVAEANQSSDELRQEKDSIVFMGMMLEKNTFLTFMWFTYAFLLVALFFFIYKYKNSNRVTLETRHTLDETREEYELHKKRAMEKEQKLKRELQDELNRRSS